MILEVFLIFMYALLQEYVHVFHRCALEPRAIMRFRMRLTSIHLTILECTLFINIYRFFPPILSIDSYSQMYLRNTRVCIGN